MPRMTQEPFAGWGGHRRNQLGRPKGDNPLVPISGAVPLSLKKAIKELAKKDGTTVSEIIREALEKVVG